MALRCDCQGRAVAIRGQIGLRNALRCWRKGVCGDYESLMETWRFVLRTPSVVMDQRIDLFSCELVEAANERVLHAVQRVCAVPASAIGFWACRLIRHSRRAYRSHSRWSKVAGEQDFFDGRLGWNKRRRTRKQGDAGLVILSVYQGTLTQHDQRRSLDWIQHNRTMGSALPSHGQSRHTSICETGFSRRLWPRSAR